jgi:hypothetical protein
MLIVSVILENPANEKEVEDGKEKSDNRRIAAEEDSGKKDDHDDGL